MALDISKESILARTFHAATVAKLDGLIEAAATGDADAKLRLAAGMEETATQPVNPEPILRQALHLYEELGEAGSVEAMERVVILYAEGSTNSKVTFAAGDSPETNVIVRTPVPDLTKAYQWCARAQRAGSEWAAKVLPRIEQAIIDDVLKTSRQPG